MVNLGRFGDFARFDAACADFHACCSALWPLHANPLQIGIETTVRAVIRV